MYQMYASKLSLFWVNKKCQFDFFPGDHKTLKVKLIISSIALNVMTNVWSFYNNTKNGNNISFFENYKNELDLWDS